MEREFIFRENAVRYLLVNAYIRYHSHRFGCTNGPRGENKERVFIRNWLIIVHTYQE